MSNLALANVHPLALAAQQDSRRGQYVGAVALHGCFVLGHRSTKLHLPEAAYAFVRNGRRRLAAATLCGAELTHATDVLEATDGLTLCDECALADYMPYVVYRFFDADDALLYVGFTSDFADRLRMHAMSPEQSPWYPAVKRWTLVSFDRPDEALAYEAQTIRAEQPLHNRQYNPRFLAQRETKGRAA